MDSANKRKPPPPAAGTISASVVPTNEKKSTKTTYNCDSSYYFNDSSTGYKLQEVLSKKHRAEIMPKHKLIREQVAEIRE